MNPPIPPGDFFAQADLPEGEEGPLKANQAPQSPSYSNNNNRKEDTSIPEVQAAWDNYTTHLRTYFFNPDIEAARIVLASAASHFHKDCDPCWLFIIGPSSGDKTSICINSLLDLPQVYMKGEISAKTFLSGYTGTAHPSLLHQIGNGILAFKDFTTFMSKRSEEQTEIASQLREIYDGSFTKDTGKGVTLKWVGKLTVIAASTPALERAWGSRRDLGERFLQVRISRKDGIQQSEYAQRQRGKEDFITRATKIFAKEFFQCIPPITNPPPDLTPNQMTRVAAMAELVAHCRGAVPRHPITNEIIDMPQIENSGRMSKSLASLISNHAALFRRKEVSEMDMAIGKRIALNTIPATRSIILDAIPKTKNGSIQTDRLIMKSGLPKSTIDILTTDLETLGVLRIQHNQVVSNEIALSANLATLWAQSFDPMSAYLPQPELKIEPPEVH